MVRRTLLAGATVAVLALSPHAARGAQPTVTTIASFPGVVRALDADGASTAWIDSSWVLRVRAGAVTHAIVYANPYQEIPNTGPARRLVEAGGWLLWESERTNGTFGIVDRIFVARPTARTGTVLSTVSRVDGADGGRIVGLAGDSAGFAFGVAVVTQSPTDQTFAVSGGGIWAVSAGHKRQIPGIPPSAVLARGGDFVAAQPFAQSATSSGAPKPLPTVQIWSVASGMLLSSVSAVNPRAAAIAGRTLVVLTGSKFVRYSVDTGQELGETTAPTGTVADLDTDGSRVAFRTSNAVDVLDSMTGRINVEVRVARPWRPVAEAVTDSTLVWAIAKRVAPGEPSPRTMVSTIRRRRI